MRKYLLLLVSLTALAACSGPDDVLENVADVSVPDQLTGCVVRDADGACQKAVCVADDEDDCSAWAEACLEHEHVSEVQGGHQTCERREADAES